MNIRTLLVFLFPLVGVLSGCAGTSTQETRFTAPAGQVVASPEQLEGGWVVYSIGARDVEGRYSPRIAFGKEQRVGGMAGCNRFLGGYELGQGGQLEFGEMRLTRRICPEPIMFQEALLLNRLRGVKNGTLTEEGDLLLYFEEGGLPIRMRPDSRREVSGAGRETRYRG